MDYSNLKRKRTSHVDISLIEFKIVDLKKLSEITNCKFDLDLTSELDMYLTSVKYLLKNYLPLEEKSKKCSLVFSIKHGQRRELHVQFMKNKIPIHKLQTCIFFQDIYSIDNERVNYL